MEYQIRTDRPPDKGHIETAIKAWLRASPMQPMGGGVLPSTELFPRISPGLWATSSTPNTFGSPARPLPGRPAAPPPVGTAGRARGVVTAPAHNPFSSHQMQTAGEITIAPGIHLRQLSQMGSRHQHVFVLREKSLLIVQQGGMHSRWLTLGHGWHQPVMHPLPAVKPHTNQAGPNLLSEVARWSGMDVGRMSTWQKLLWAAAQGVGQVNAELMQVVEDLLTWEGILSLAVIGGLLAIPVVGEVVLVGLAGVAIYDLLRNVSALFMQYWESAQSARTLGQLEQAGKYFAQALVRGLLDLLAVVAGGAALVRSVRTVQVWRSGGKPVLRTALELVAEWAKQLWGRLRGGTKRVTEWVEVEYVEKGPDAHSGKPQSGRTGYLGSPRLNRRQLAELKRKAKEYGVDLEVVKDKRILRMMDENNAQAAFDPVTGKIYVRPGATYYEVAHEMAHAEQYARVGKEAYSKLTRLEKETYVYEQLMKQNDKLTDAEKRDALRYINDIRDRYNLPPLKQ